MNCPKCTISMDRHSRHGVEIEHCPACGGVWLGRGELDHLLDAVRPAVTLANPEPARPKPAPAPGGRDIRAKGPVSAKPRPAERFEDRAGTGRSRPGDSRRYGGRYSRKSRLADLLEELFDFD